MARHSITVLASLSVFRILSVFFVTSWFVPDEIYQSAEVAHKLVFGTGQLSWEWVAALRSYFHPSLVVLVYKILIFIGLDDSRTLIWLAPRFFHALIFSFGDFSFFQLCYRICPTSDIAKYSFLSYICSWFVFYCAPRTLSNSLETSLTLIALNWFPFERRSSQKIVWPYIALGVLTIVIRPTVALIWIVFGLHHLINCSHPLRLLSRTVLPVSIPILAATIVIDSWAYGRLTIPLWNFLSFNVLEGGSAMFGVHPWYWYFTDGLTSVFTVQLIPIIIGIFSSNVLRPTLLPLAASTFYVAFHSLLPHKEQRFLLPIIPLLCLYSGTAFNRLRHWKAISFISMLLINICVAVFASRFHQVGPFNASDAVLQMTLGKNTTSIAALMPCYSLPGHSYFHNQVAHIRQLDCSPGIDGSRRGAPDEADQFHINVTNWLSTVFEKEYNQYEYLLLYEKTFIAAKKWLNAHGFDECAKVFHSFVLTSSREDNFVVVLCKTG